MVLLAEKTARARPRRLVWAVGVGGAWPRELFGPTPLTVHSSWVTSWSGWALKTNHAGLQQLPCPPCWLVGAEFSRQREAASSGRSGGFILERSEGHGVQDSSKKRLEKGMGCFVKGPPWGQGDRWMPAGFRSTSGYFEGIMKRLTAQCSFSPGHFPSFLPYSFELAPFAELSCESSSVPSHAETPAAGLRQPLSLLL